jgi:hypothetical protein
MLLVALILPLDRLDFRENDIFGCDWCTQHESGILFTYVLNDSPFIEFRCMDHFPFVSQPKSDG